MTCTQPGSSAYCNDLSDIFLWFIYGILSQLVILCVVL